MGGVSKQRVDFREHREKDDRKRKQNGVVVRIAAGLGGGGGGHIHGSLFEVVFEVFWNASRVFDRHFRCFAVGHVEEDEV